MAGEWMVSAAATQVAFGAAGGQISFTVTNVGPTEDQVILEVVPSDGAQRDWFAVSEPQRRLRPGASDAFLVNVTVPPNAPAGSYSVQARVFSSDTPPEENSRLSERVSFVVATPAQPKKRARWPYVLAAAALVLVVLLTVGFLLTRRSGPGPKAAGPSPSAKTSARPAPVPPCPKCMVPLESPDLQEPDCITYDPNTLSVVSNPAGFYVQDAANKLRLTLDDAKAAGEALILAKSYTQLCSIGRKNPVPGEEIVRYWHQTSGIQAGSFMATCIPYDNHITVSQTAPDIWSVEGRERREADGGTGRLGPLKFHSKVEADNMARLASSFSAVCFVGSIMGQYVEYWQ